MGILKFIAKSIYAFSFIDYLVVVFVATTIYLTIKKKLNDKKTKIFIIVLFSLYLIFLLSVTFLGREKQYNDPILIPLYSYFLFFTGENSEAIRSNMSNVIMFYPLGLFLFDLINTKNKKKVVFFSALSFSFIIELIQYIFCIGLFEVDDILHNTFGALIGLYSHKIIPLIFKKIKTIDL